MSVTNLYSKSPQVVISIQFPDSLRDYGKDLRAKLPGMMRKIARDGKNFWKSEAGRKLKSSRNMYQAAIQMQVVDDTSLYISLEGFLPFAIDQGMSGFNMKAGLLKGATKISPKVGRYRVIPLNVNRYINMTVPKVFATVSEHGKAKWQHPAFKAMKISDAVVEELDRVIIPRHVKETLGEL